MEDLDFVVFAGLDFAVAVSTDDALAIVDLEDGFEGLEVVGGFVGFLIWIG